MTNAAPTPGKLIVMMGAPGAGKTTWRARQSGVQVVCLDELRARFSECGCEGNQIVTALAVGLAKGSTRFTLSRGETVLWDATSARREHRDELRALAAEYGASTELVVFHPPKDIVLARNARRSATPCVTCGYPRAVPEEIVRSMYAEIAEALPGLPGEGWGSVRWPELSTGKLDKPN